MSQDAIVSDVQAEPAAGISSPESRRLPGSSVVPARMQYRSRPVSVSVDPVSLVISECISITSAIHKHARSPHSSVSAILGGSPTPVQVGPPSPALPGRKSIATTLGGDSADPSLTNRWGLRGKRGKSIQDNPLMAGFGRLRHELATVRDIHAFDALALLNPFLQIVQTKGTAAAITILTLGALRKFLAYGFICPTSPRFPLAMQSLAAAVTRCQFDTSDSGQVEVVLLMILHLMEDMMSGPGGDILSDESVCDMMGRGLAICSQPRFSPVLRRTAEAAMVRMCQIIFEDVKHLEVEAGSDPEALDRQANGELGNVTISAAPSGPAAGSLSVSAEAEARASTSTETAEPKASTDANGASEVDTAETETNDDTDSLDLRPYSLPSVRELFRVLVSFLDPNDRQHTDTMRVMALRIIHVALEVSGPTIARHPALAVIAEDRLCCYLFQLVRSDNMAILQESLIVAGTLLATCRGVLKLQQELFLSYLAACLHPAVEIPREPGIDPSLYAGIPQAPKLVKPSPSQAGSGRSTPVPVKDRQKLGLEGGARKPDARQAMVESIGVLSRMPTFMTELFVNYDCDPDRADLCEDLIGLLARNALPDSATWSTTSVPPLCLDALLRFVQFIADRLETTTSSDQELPSPESIREQRRRKKIIIKGTAKFNESAKGGLAYLEAQGIIEDVKDPAALAKFLRQTSRVNKKVLGEFLSKRGNEAILTAYMNCLDFERKRADEALRTMLETFRLPGESPLIERIVTTFAQVYCAKTMPEEIANQDALYVLTYAIIMLNTDQHNPNLKSNKRMTLEDFSRNLRGVNNGKDFDPTYIQDIFDSIRTNEIILPDEHDNQHAFDYAWRELIFKSESVGPLILCDTNIYDADIFATTWRPIVSTLSYVFMSATDDAVFARVVTGFDECARIATKYGNREALDQIVYSLSYMTTLAGEKSFNTTLNTEVAAGENRVMVSELAVKLGRDFRAQLATLVLFRVVTGSEAYIQNGWKHVVRIWLNLFTNSLIPAHFLQDSPLPSIAPIPLQSPSQVIDRANKVAETGFFSAFTNYISSYAADDPPEPSDEELESTLCTVDCVNSCHMSSVFNNISKLSAEDVAALVDGLLDSIPEDQAISVITVKSDNVPPGQQQKPEATHVAPAYDPSVVFALEFATVLAMRDEQTVELFGKKVMETLHSVLRDASQHHHLVVSRAAFYLLNLLRASHTHDFVNVPVLLHTISSFPKDTLARSSILVIQGLKTCIEGPGPVRNTIMTSPDFWVIMRAFATRYDSAPVVFELLEQGCTAVPATIMADNYEAAMLLLSDFASAAGRAVLAERKQAQRARKTREAQPEPAKDSDTVARGVRAITTMYNMTARIPELMKQSHLESSEAWSAYWLPLLQGLANQCTNPCRDVRLLAFNSLQRSLLSADVTCNDHKEWTAIFGEVLFPLINKLLKPEVFSSDREGMGEMRVQTSSLLCKVFLQCLVLLSEIDGLLDLWIQIIDIMDRLMNSGQGDSLEDAVRENLKNVLLFMASSEHLVPPSKDPSKETFWNETWKRIDRFVPDLRNDLALEEPASEKQAEKVEEPAAAPQTQEKQEA
ncbi:Sec7 domain-containing protein [Plectosphaerella cucumerina]|uniref:Sec7 domain-containing protein n=1 Tax=Plectosphaerella cucumerina TaxID=40658 RepID=A0A8K0TBD3_9PEZI|nr:Sec7 domain-containing protein [Plectosphaerella cucumerina]